MEYGYWNIKLIILCNTHNYCVYRTYIEGLAITHTISIHKNPEKKNTLRF